MTEQELQKMWDGLEVDLKERFGKSAKKTTSTASVLSSATSNRRWSAEGDQHDSNRVDSLGTQVINSDAFKGWNRRGKVAIEIPIRSRSPLLFGSGGAFILCLTIDLSRRYFARRRLTVRDLLQPGTTTSNAVEYPRQTALLYQQRGDGRRRSYQARN